MQEADWNDLRYLLALHRAGSFAAAAKALGVNETTVARRVRALERVTGAPLVQGAATRSAEITEAGQAALRHAEAVEAEIDALGDTMGRQRRMLLGTVRVTAVPIVVNRILVPQLPGLMALHPHLTVELIADGRNLMLTRREADLALRLARPQTGGHDVTARKLGRLRYSIYAPAGLPQDRIAAIGWIVFGEGHAHLPPARWLADAQRRDDPDGPALRVSDAETATEAVAAGLGKSLLPDAAAARDTRLQRFAASGRPAEIMRDVWLLSHRAQARTQSVRAVADWLSGLDWTV